MWQPFKQIYYLAPDNTKLYFFEGRTRALQSWQNFGMPEINFIEDRGPNQHGTTVRDWRAQTRTITLDWFGQRCDGRQCEYAAVIEKIRPTQSGSPGYLRVINQDTSLLEIPAWIQQGPAGNWSIDSGLRNLQVRDALQFHCADPIWREAVQRTATATLEVVDSCLPFCLPMCLGSGLLSADFNICYNGTWPGDQITFVITGPIDTPTITNATTGQVIQLNYNIAANETVTIVILPEFISVTSNISGNIIGTVTNVSDLVFFNLAPRQTNVVTLSGVNAIEGSSSISMRYYTRYLSVYDSCVQIDCEEEEIVNPNAFITSWNTANTSTGSSANNQVRLPLVSTGTYNFIVDWGDGSNQDTITAWNQAETTHTYATSGIYTVTITGQCEGWRFNNTGDRLKILNVSQWGTGFRFGNDNGYFYGCSNLIVTANDIPNTAGVTTFSNLFRSCTSLTTIPNMENWDVSNITTLLGTFQDCTLFNQNIGGWNVSNVANMTNTFRSCTNFNQDISSWDISGLNTAAGTFNAAVSFNQNLSTWNVSNVNVMNSMFRQATSFNQNIGGWDVSNVVQMISMFEDAALSTTNYDALLIGWQSQSPSLQNGVNFHGGNSQYSAGAAATARAALISTHSWSITDGGPV